MSDTPNGDKNEAIMENGRMKYARCGICDLNNIKDWDSHALTPKHKTYIKRYQEVMMITRGHMDKKDMIKVIRGEKTLSDYGF